ncbi:hypothetical protein TD95_005229 [Thielaviopsis punctulata]|uniref:Ubiquitin carboxyl-terminal hydrolase n=1 Tax=Thielaviopsis punctulata TaxID=72032 RepID=A0A0F4ZAB3_9PEZI|nr:hypothetical protein TD95_005229 [Thielaviopsis punctulata]
MTDPAPSALSFIPLEANPELLTSLLHTLGLSPALAMHDVFSLTDADMLSFVPRPALALLLVFPVSAQYEAQRECEDAALPLYNDAGDEHVVWFPQTIRNACGMMGLLHAVSNGPARDMIEPGSTLANILDAAIPLPARQRHTVLESSTPLATAHSSAAVQGDTAAPEATADVDLHYVCFVKGRDGALWELDGRRKGPLKRCDLGPEEDVLCEKALESGPLRFLAAEAENGGGELRFSCVALASAA